MKTTVQLTANQAQLLARYVVNPGYGRGRIVGDTAVLFHRNMLTLTWLSRTEWSLAISEYGKRFIAEYQAR